MIKDELRLPLSPLSDKFRPELKKLLTDAGVKTA